jgi:metal-sulfur cluster biosynthetic enzyme
MLTGLLWRPQQGEREAAVTIEEQIKDQIRTCFDPEIPVNVWDLGLVYGIAVEGPIVDITMTFTSESCPSARQIPEDIRRKVGTLAGIEEVNFHIVWEPPWHPRMISETGKKELGMDEEGLDGPPI